VYTAVAGSRTVLDAQWTFRWDTGLTRRIDFLFAKGVSSVSGGETITWDAASSAAGAIALAPLWTDERSGGP
jgi:hypothetical protein